MVAASPLSYQGSSITLQTLANIPHIKPGDNISRLLLESLSANDITLQDGDVIVIAHKIVSKAEGRLINLDDVTPGERAHEIASSTNKDPRLVELILRESSSISRKRNGVLIVRHRLGFTSANAGIDRSNVAQYTTGETVLLLPEDPDRSAMMIRKSIQEEAGVAIGVVISDSHGRPFRLGTTGVAIGVSGLPALWDRRGEVDLYGYELQHTEVGVADEVAGAASLMMGQAAEGTPVVLIRGLNLPANDGQARDLIRPLEIDLYQ